MSENDTKPTVHDVAREAGVSLATVDRVLNNRPNVRKVTQDRVKAAIQRLGYVRDLNAANLARRKTYRFVFLLPERGNQYVETLYEAVGDLREANATNRTEIRVIEIPRFDPHAVAHRLDSFTSGNIDGVAIMAPETPQVRDAIARLRARDINVVALVSDQPNSGRDHFVGIDNVAAGRTAGVLMGRFLHREAPKVLVVTNSMQARDSVDRRLGFDAIISSRFGHIKILPTLETHGDTARAREVLARTARMHPDISGIYSLVSTDRGLLTEIREAALMRDCVTVAHELTRHTREALVRGEIDAVITQNVGHLVRSAVRVLRARRDRVPIDQSQERIRIEIVLRENLP